MNNVIDKFTPAGVRSVFASTDLGLAGLSGLAFDSAGNLYVANTLGKNIERFTPDGVGSLFANTPGSAPQGLAFTDDAGVPLPLANLPEPAALSLLNGYATLLRRRCASM